MSELIDREATVKQICKIGEMVGGHDRDVVISIALFVQDDKTAFPTIDRSHGKWIEGIIGYHYCSECHNYALADDDLADDDGKEVLSNFCPNCGSDNRPREGESE